MTLQNPNNGGRPAQTRTQKIVMWCVFGVAAVLAVIAIVLFVSSGASFF